MNLRFLGFLSMLSLILLICSLLEVVAVGSVYANPPKSSVKYTAKNSPWSAWREIKQQARCKGKIVKAFTEKDAGDSVVSNPEPIVLSTSPNVSRYEKALCVEEDAGRPYRKSLEWVQLKSGLSVAVTRQGWESSGLGFYWVLPPDNHSFTDKPYWLKRSTALLKTALPMMHQSDTWVVSDAIQMIQNHAGMKDPLGLENTVLDNGQEIATRVFWDKMRSLPGGRKAIQITIAIGPL